MKEEEEASRKEKQERLNAWWRILKSSQPEGRKEKNVKMIAISEWNIKKYQTKLWKYNSQKDNSEMSRKMKKEKKAC